MPELPEVQTIVNDLNAKLPNLKIKQFILLNQKSGLKKSLLNLELAEFKAKLEKQKIIIVRRRAKHILIELSSGLVAIHLKMTGQLIYVGSDPSKAIVGGHPIIGQGKELPNRFTRAVFIFSDNSKLYFNDVRRFGWIRYYSKQEWQVESDKSGLEPLEANFTSAALKNILQKKAKSTVKQAIMDAKHLVGVGNIYADESLFTAKIKPGRKAGSLTDLEIKKLWQKIQSILILSIEKRGTSFNDYVDASGAKGNFVSMLQVYGRGGQKCYKCQSILRKSKIGGRGTVWCDNCQL